MIRHKRFIAGTVAAAVVLIGCGDQRSASPMSPSISAASATRQSDERGSLSASSPRSGPLHITKDCSEYTRLAGSFCTITASNIKEIEVGSKVIYASAAGATSLDSDVILDPPSPGNNTASGHVTLDLATGRGVVTFSGGTGRFTNFNATIVVTHVTGRSFAWDGTYSFGGKAEHCDED